MSQPLRGSSASWSPFLFDWRSRRKRLPFQVAGAEISTTRNNNREVVMRLEGGCYCGEVRYVAEGDPMMQAQCHCRECQYISGGAPNTFIAMPAAGFSYITGQRAECGTHLVTKVPGLPAAILKVGTLDDPKQFHPQMAV